MNKRVKRNIASFQRSQRRSARYHISQYTPHEQAIREHVMRGYSDPRRYGVLSDLAAYDQELGLLDQRNKL